MGRRQLRKDGMANREKGEVAFEANGKTYTLVNNTSALVKLQGKFNTDKTVARLEDIDRMVKAGSLLHVTTAFWALLQKYHAAEFQTVDQACDLIDVAGEVAGRALLEAMGASVPDPADVKELGGESPNPPKARARKPRGNGAISISPRGASA